jgi:hypothetical protein
MSVFFFNEAPLVKCAASSIATLHQQQNRLSETDASSCLDKAPVVQPSIQ